MTKDNSGIQEARMHLQNSRDEFSDLLGMKDSIIRENQQQIDALQLRKRPQYPTDEITEAVDRIRNMTIEEYDEIPSFIENIEFSKNVSFVPFHFDLDGKPMVVITSGAPYSEVTGSRLWQFESRDVTSIIHAFERKGVRVQQTRVTEDDQKLLLAIETPWLL